jgi:hypothetical protein
MEESVRDKRDAPASVEVNCQRLGDLAGLAVPAEAQFPGAGQWAEIERRFDGHGRWLSPRRRWPALAVCAAIVLCVGAWLVARRPLGYRLEGCTLATDGNFETSANHGGTIAFEDGSHVSIEKDARFRLGMLPFGRGAEINLDEGEARLAVFHRAKARWAVLAGPFRIDVTGTRFGVLWSRHRGQFRLTMLEGEVRVAGGAVPADTRVHAGQTLNADLVGGTFEIANERASATEKPEEATAARALPASPAGSNSAGPHEARPPLPTALPRKRLEPAPRVERRFASAPEPTEREPSTEPALPAPTESPNAAAPPAPSAPEPSLPPIHTAIPAEPTKAVELKPTSMRVVFGETGQLANGFTGATWIASGDGTSFSTPSFVGWTRPSSARGRPFVHQGNRGWAVLRERRDAEDLLQLGSQLGPSHRLARTERPEGLGRRGRGRYRGRVPRALRQLSPERTPQGRSQRAHLLHRELQVRPGGAAVDVQVGVLVRQRRHPRGFSAGRHLQPAVHLGHELRRLQVLRFGHHALPVTAECPTS